jgi:hypothetical protein
MWRLVILATLALVVSPFTEAQNLTGDWQATLSAGDAEQRLLLHIPKSPDGSFKATFDSIDLGQNGLAVTNLDIEGPNLTFEVDDLDADFKGRLQDDGKTIDGRWQQGRPFDVEFTRAVAPAEKDLRPAKPSDIDGKWIGTLDFGNNKLRVVINIVNTSNGLTATLGSPDQGPQTLPATAVTRDGASLKIEAKGIAGIYEGKIAADHASIDGTWTQGDHGLALVLKPMKDQPTQIQSKPAETKPNQ